MKNDESSENVDMSHLDATSFDMSALIDACKEISTNHEVEEKVKKTNLFMKHILNAYDEIVEEGADGKEHISETFLKKLKKSKKREPSFKQNRRQLLLRFAAILQTRVVHVQALREGAELHRALFLHQGEAAGNENRNDTHVSITQS